MECVNLMERFGDRYRISYDEADGRQRREIVDPWLLTIPCERGVIFPHGGDALAVEVDGRPITAKRLKALSCCRVHQEGDNECTFLFAVADIDAVAAIVLPRRKRQVSDAERARLAEMSREHGFKPRDPAIKHQSGHPQGVPA